MTDDRLLNSEVGKRRKNRHINNIGIDEFSNLGNDESCDIKSNTSEACD
jgi:hypothetical protein